MAIQFEYTMMRCVNDNPWTIKTTCLAYMHWNISDQRRTRKDSVAPPVLDKDKKA